MRVVGLDIGNATTEAVLAEVHNGQIKHSRRYDRLPTRGAKGSPASLDAAARLVRQARRRARWPSRRGCRRATAAGLHDDHDPAGATRQHGRLRVEAAGASTTGGAGVGVGKPFQVGSALPDGPAVALVPASRGYRSVIDELRDLATRGVLAAVVVERDEAVLIANRLPTGIPVVDEVSVDGLAQALLIAVEVRSPLRSLVDPLWMVAHLGLSADEQADAVLVASRLYDRANAVVALSATSALGLVTQAASMTLVDGSSRALSPAFLAAHPPGLVRSYQLPDGPPRAVDDLFAVDLAAVADDRLTRGDAVASRTVALAALHADAPYADPGPALSVLLDVLVHTATSEAVVARLGALSTPGAPPGAVVVDLGGGTIDVISAASPAASGATVLAGAGELLTAATAAVLGIASTPAEWAKRGPASRVEAPQLLLAEDGTRTFLDAPIRPDAMGALVVRGPAGWLPFDRRLAPSEWRALRLRLKTEILGANLARALPEAPGARSWSSAAPPATTRS